MNCLWTLLIATLFIASSNAALTPVYLSLAEEVSESASGDSAVLDMSEDGTLLLVLSSAPNLVPEDNQSWSLDLFLYNTANKQFTLISRSIEGKGGGNGSSGNAAFARNGRWVAFDSEASDLISGDSNDVRDVFLYDIQTKTTTLVSRPANPLLRPGHSELNGVTADGRFIFFESFSDAVFGQVNSNLFSQVFRYDRASGAIERVTTGVGRRSDLNYHAEPSWSEDGQHVAFVASPLNGGSTAPAEIYLRDMSQSQPRLISAGAAALVSARAPGSGSVDCGGPVIFEQGSSVVFHATGLSSSRSFLLRWTRATGLLEVLAEMDYALAAGTELGPTLSLDGAVAFVRSGNVHVMNSGQQPVLVTKTEDGDPSSGRAAFPQFSGNGEHLIFTSDADDLDERATNGADQVYRANARTLEVELASVTTNGVSVSGEGLLPPVVSADGRHLAFETIASGLASGDINGMSDVFLRDMLSGELSLITRPPSNLQSITGNGASFARERSVSQDGSRVLFMTQAGNLTKNATEGERQLLLYEKEGGARRVIDFGTSNGVLDVIGPKLSADGARLAYLRRDGPGFQSLVTHNLDTGERRVLFSTNSEALAYDADDTLSVFSLTQPLTPLRTSAFVITDQNGSGAIESHTHLSRGLLSISPNGRFVAQVTELSISDAKLILRDRTTGETNVVLSRPGGAQRMTQVMPSSRGDILFESESRWHLLRQGADPAAVPGTITIPPVFSRSGNAMAHPTTNTNPVFAARVVHFDTGLARDFTLPAMEPQMAFTSVALSPDGQYLAARVAPRNTTGSPSTLHIYNVLDGSAKIFPDFPEEPDSLRAAPAFSGDSRTFVFNSSAPFATNDFNRALDVLALTLPDLDADDDYLPDAWELAALGNLSGSFGDDPDNDGALNAREYRAGTDPRDAASVFTIESFALLPEGMLRVGWRSVAGASYEVQSSVGISGSEWVTEAVVLSAPGASSVVEIPATGEMARFFRVVAR